VEFVGFSWTAGARKHRISRTLVRHVVEHAGLVFVREASPPGRPDEALLFVGDDADGTALEVVGVELSDGRLRVIHAMVMRPAYRDLYEEAKTWRL
jgi:hypothetical protein